MRPSRSSLVVGSKSPFRRAGSFSWTAAPRWACARSSPEIGDLRVEFVALEAGDCRLELPLSLQQVAEVVVGLGEVGLEPDRLATRRWPRRASLVAQSVAEVIVGHGVVGLQPDRLAKRGDGPASLPRRPGRRRGCSGPRRSRASAGSPRGTRRSPRPASPGRAGRCRGCSGPRRRRASAGSPRGTRRWPRPASPGPPGRCRGCCGPRRRRA